MSVYTWVASPFTLTFHAPAVSYLVPLMLYHPLSSDPRLIGMVVASEYRRLLLEDQERQPACWQ